MPDGIFVHPEYNPLNFNNDIALLQLLLPFRLNTKYIWPIPLVSRSEGKLDWEGETAVATGWGKTEQAAAAGELRFVNLKIEDQNACRNLYPQGYVNEGVICANTDHGTKAACQGDFGGPLATRNGHLLGVSSFMSACGCEDGIPIGFARVSHYLDWIHEVSGISIE